jgi:hypothetical protein
VGAGAALTLALIPAAGAQDQPTGEIRAFRAEADTYVSEAAPRRNFGTLRALRADGDPQSTIYVRFRTTRLKGEIDSVTLLLHAQARVRTGYQVRRVYEDDWRERALTYENAPRLSLRYASSRPVRRGAWSAVDVTAFIADDDNEVSLAITTRSPRGVVFASRESRHGPRLVFRTERKGREAPPGP